MATHIPPQWTSSDLTSRSLDPTWLSKVLPKEDNFGSLVSCTPIIDASGMMGEIVRLHFDTGKTLILKQLYNPQKLKTALLLGLSREAHFYNSSDFLASHVQDVIPRVYYAYADENTGERYLILEDLSDAFQLGFLFGPGNPNNWLKHKSGDLARIESKYLTDDKKMTLLSMTGATWRAAARLHAFFWNDQRLMTIPWLRSVNWWNHSLDDEQRKKVWWPPMKGALDHWKESKANNVFEKNPEVWPQEIVKLVEASLNKISYESYMEFIQQNPFTLAHGDFHPANILWRPSIDDEDKTKLSVNHVKILDWELVGIGSGPQDLGQFMISHVDPQLRKQIEKPLVEEYYQELVRLNPSIGTSYSWDRCWNEYIQGGMGRWAWFLAWFSTVMPIPNLTFFNQQVLCFAQDHQITIENVPQPRI